MNRIKKVTTLSALNYLYSSSNIIIEYNYKIYRIKRIIERNRFGIGFIKNEKNTEI